MKHTFTLMLLAGLSLSLFTACGTGKEPSPQTPTATIEPTSIPVTYEATPGETIHRLPSPGDSEPYSDLGIGTDVRLEEYMDESGAVVERWEAVMWLYNEHCHVWRGRTVYTGDVVEFAGYRIRVLDVSSDTVVVAISGKPLDPLEIAAACALSIYNTLPGESRVSMYRESYKTDSIEFHKGGDLWIEEYVDWNGETVEGPAIRLKIVSEQQAEVWEGVVHAGEMIEFGGYRIRILVINETFVDLAFAKLGELQP